MAIYFRGSEFENFTIAGQWQYDMPSSYDRIYNYIRRWMRPVVSSGASATGYFDGGAVLTTAGATIETYMEAWNTQTTPFLALRTVDLSG